MTDYRTEGPLNGGGAPIDAVDDDLSDIGASYERPRKVDKVLDKAEGLAARRLGALEARRLREQADDAIARGQGAYERGRAFLDDQLVTAPYRTVAAAAVVGLLAGVILTPRKKKIVYRSR
jgi:ElaB/YqjD/DUF883 family membrane-anchored ribosome-binding protein